MNPNDPVHAYHLGWAAALLYAQASNDVEGGSQTLTSHLPKSDYEDGGAFDKDLFVEAIKDLDSEGGVTSWRFGTDKWGSDTIEIASSEGFFGMPSWVE